MSAAIGLIDVAQQKKKKKNSSGIFVFLNSSQLTPEYLLENDWNRTGFRSNAMRSKPARELPPEKRVKLSFMKN